MRWSLVVTEAADQDARQLGTRILADDIFCPGDMTKNAP